MPATCAAAESCIRVSRGRAGNVIALAVKDGHQAVPPGVAQDMLEHRQTGRTAGFKERALRLDDRHQWGNDGNHPCAELFKGSGHGGQRAVAVPQSQFNRQGIPTRVEADAEGIALAAHRSGQPVGKVSRHNFGLIQLVYGARAGVLVWPAGEPTCKSLRTSYTPGVKRRSASAMVFL